ncbi:hypothetical protein QO207_21720 [Pseudomonas sp. CAN2814]|uniref:hypothetical protein n=1 Tax=Pseudomonas sp. CAN1 TaxID=3046726 RepID=UPI00264815CD|nr:hypothetical protein [Pseudomonas sp. CAN1]MDN6859219.1 hypothetical protein [Pseudomonas sp. CAN1]
MIKLNNFKTLLIAITTQSSVAFAATEITTCEAKNIYPPNYTPRLITKGSPTEHTSSASQDCRVTFLDTKHNNQTNDEYIKTYSPVKSWSCVNAGEALQYGYDTDDEKITYSYKVKSWKLSSHSAKKSNTKLYNIKSKNPYGYLITKSTAPYNFHFCMVQNYQALCGDGNIPVTEAQEITRLKKILSSFQFETVESNN